MTVSGCGGGGGALGGGGTEEAVVVRTGETDVSGRAAFVDGQTGEAVELEVTNESGTPLGGMLVGFFDGSGFEAFVVEDPTSEYAASLQVYPHNSSHSITAYAQSDVPRLKQVAGTSEEGVAMARFIGYACRNGQYLGWRTPGQLENEDIVCLAVLDLTSLKPELAFFEKAGKVAQIADEFSDWKEPEFYDVHRLGFGDPLTANVRVLISVLGEGGG